MTLLFQYPNTYTLRSLNEGHRMSTSLRQSQWGYCEGYRTSSSILPAYSNAYLTTKVISKYLLDSYCHCRAQRGVAKRVLAIDSLCRVRMGVVKRVLAFNSLFRVGTGVTKHVLAFGSLCGAQTGVAKHVIALNSSNGV